MILYSQDKLRAELRRDEGYRRFPYTDTTGNLTIGVGWNLSANGLPDFVIEQLLDIGVTQARQVVSEALPEWRTLSDARQRVLINMGYNLGNKLKSFRRTLAAVKRGDYEAAARGMLRSRWAKQVGDRAKRLAKMMQEG